MPRPRIPAGERSASHGHDRRIAVRALAAILLPVIVAVFGGLHASAATFPGMYEATVPLSDRSERGQAEAVRAAMKVVLVRVTGRREAAEDPSLAPLVEDARRYIQQFRVIGGSQFFAGFDGARLERAVVEAGQPLWGHERPATLVVVVEESGRRIVQAGEAESSLRNAVARGATARGLPIVWPEASRPVDLADLGAQGIASIQQAYGADAVLVGRLARGGQARWTLYHGPAPSEWIGSLEDGAHGAADAFATLFAAATTTPGGSDVAIAVSGIDGVRDYANVTSYLESLSLISTLVVEQLAGDTVVYRARVQGDADRLARAIALGQRLVPVDPGAPAGSELRFRLRQ
jgi:hypothetical protein